MAWDSSKGRTAVFPSKLKSFVRDMKHLRRSGSQAHLKSEEPIANSSPDDTQVTEQDLSLEEQPQGQAGISVELSVRFDDPLGFSLSRCYNSSESFEPNERLLRGLIRRIDHGSFELITRKDSHALTPSQGKGELKPRRFELIYQIYQKGSHWATRTYTSYQRPPVTAEGAKEVVLSSNRLIGLFLRCHDSAFFWRDGPIRDEVNEEIETAPYRVGSIQPMSCIPRSRFLEESQSFEVIPGYFLELLIVSQSQGRNVAEWQKSITINSEQGTPLNLAAAEALFSNASYALESALRSRRRLIDERHRHTCGGLITATCPHYEDNATEIKLRVSNKLGPKFDHLEKSIQTKVAILAQPESKECVDFINSLENKLEDARDAADRVVDEMNDLDFRIIEVAGRGWKLEEPLGFTLGPSDSYSRRSVQAILDRVQTGVAETLRGNAVTVRMTAMKRGHFILDKTLVARMPNTDNVRWTPSKSKERTVNRLKLRIEQDIKMICKDTCSLDNLDDDVSKDEPRSDILDAPAIIQVESQPPEAPRVESEGVQTENYDSNSEYSFPTKAEAQASQEQSERATPTSPTKSISSERTNSLKSFRNPKTGVRIFPLVPNSSTFDKVDFDDGDSFQLPFHGATSSLVTERTRSSLAVNNRGVTSEDPKHNASLPEASSVNEQATVAVETVEANSTEIVKASEEDSNTHDVETIASTPRRDVRKPESDADSLSIAPSTPSLVYGGCASARSSLLLYTPQIHGSFSGTEMELPVPSTPTEYHDDHHAHPEANEIETPQHFFKSNPTDSPSLRAANMLRHRHSPSPLQHQDSAIDNELSFTEDKQVQDGADGHAENGDSVKPPEDAESGPPLKTKLEKEILQEPVPEAVASEPAQSTIAPELDDIGTGDHATTSRPLITLTSSDDTVERVSAEQQGTAKNDVCTPPNDAPGSSPEEGFAQTRQDFDFSSPLTAQTDEPRGEQSEDSNSRPQTPTRTWQSTAVSPVSRKRPTLNRGRRNSFGSAGLVGFHSGEPWLYEISRRTALMLRGRGRDVGGALTPMRFSILQDTLHRRALSAGRGLELARSPLDLRGRVPANNEGRLTKKRSASTSTLQDITTLRDQNKAMHGDSSPSGPSSDSGSPGGEKHKDTRPTLQGRERSGSWRFLFAGVSLASQIIKPPAPE